MYTIDELDRVVSVASVPGCEPGAPMPFVLADGDQVLLGYSAAPDGADSVLLRFVLPHAHYFGAPNDEALSGHPLWSRGLQHYGIYEVVGSSWIRALERMNRVHRLHRPEIYKHLHHFIFTFHDETFECVAEAMEQAALVVNAKGARGVCLERAFRLLHSGEE